VARSFKPSPRRNPYVHIKKVEGKRSGLETAIALDLWGGGRAVGFKEEKDIAAIEYRNLKVKKYHPDFELPNGIIIEAKGWFKTADRTKHLCIKYQHPELDIRFVFNNPNAKLNKKSKTTYAMWCEKNGFKYAKGLVPRAWINEPPKPEEWKGVNGICNAPGVPFDKW
jgi:hypothetical protein